MVEILRSAQDDTSRKEGRSDEQNALGQRPCGGGVSGGVGVPGKCVILWGRRGRWRPATHGEGGVQWDILGLKTSHFESFQSWTLRNVSHFETFESWRAYKASHFESFRGWRRDKASHFESSGDFRLREVSHGESFGGCRRREVSHGESWRRPGPGRPWAWRGAGDRGRFCGVSTWARCLAGRWSRLDLRAHGSAGINGREVS